MSAKRLCRPTDDSPLQTVIKLTYVACFGFIRYTAGGCNGFPSCFQRFLEADDDTCDSVGGRGGGGGKGVKKKKKNPNNCQIRYAILTQFHLE